MIYIVSVSGGKDSGAVAIWFVKNLPKDLTEAHFVFSDTGIEPASVYSFLDDLEAKVIKPAGFSLSRISKPHEGYETAWDSVYDRNRPLLCGPNKGQPAKPVMPGPVMRSCTQRLKILPLRAWRKTNIPKNSPVTWVIGFRIDEGSAERRRVENKSIMANGDSLWRPFMEGAGVNIDGVHQIIKDAGLELPGFYKWTTRSGCALCFYKPLRDIIRAYVHERPLFDKMSELEEKAITANGRRASPYVLIFKMTLTEIIAANEDKIKAAEIDLDERGCDDDLKSCML